MSDQSLTETIRAAMIAALTARDKARLGTMRLIQAAFKRLAVAERSERDDASALAVLDNWVSQRRDSAQLYNDAGRTELADIENAEIAVLQEFLPAQLTEDEIIAMIDDAIAASGAEGMQAMGAVMGQLKPKLAGRADIGKVSGMVKGRLAG